jgi:hypothetical protein
MRSSLRVGRRVEPTRGATESRRPVQGGPVVAPRGVTPSGADSVAGGGRVCTAGGGGARVATTEGRRR